VKLVDHFRIPGFYQTALQKAFAVYSFFIRNTLKKVLFSILLYKMITHLPPRNYFFLCVVKQVSFFSLLCASVISLLNSSFLFYRILGNYNLLLLWNILIP